MKKASETIEAELPFLRRYARAVLGNASAGDRAVEELLEQIIEAHIPGIDRLTLFRQLEETLGQQHLCGSAKVPAGRLTPASRRAFLITAMENFSEADAASIMGISGADVAKHLESAYQELESLNASRVLIIEDEPLIVGSLSFIVESLGHSVAGVAVTAQQAVAKASELRPDLILADIQLADGSQGTDAIDEIRARLSLPVVYVTAYPERMLSGRRGEPTFLITKPFRPAQVKAVVSQALFLQAIAA